MLSNRGIPVKASSHGHEDLSPQPHAPCQPFYKTILLNFILSMFNTFFPTLYGICLRVFKNSQADFFSFKPSLRKHQTSGPCQPDKILKVTSTCGTRPRGTSHAAERSGEGRGASENRLLASCPADLWRSLTRGSGIKNGSGLGLRGAESGRLSGKRPGVFQPQR